MPEKLSRNDIDRSSPEYRTGLFKDVLFTILILMAVSMVLGFIGISLCARAFE